MKIATWNIERLKHKGQLDEILFHCKQIKANILVLTETDTRVSPDYKYHIQTPPMSEIQPNFYQPTENRVSIYTDYKCACQYATFDKYTAVCAELETEVGNLIVYGTIIGVYGNRHTSFLPDLTRQMAYITRISESGKPLCFAGDYNTSFADNYYFTVEGRQRLTECFAKNNVRLLTKACPECIDQIAVSESFVGESTVLIEEWNIDKRLSDHKGVGVIIPSPFTNQQN